MSDKELIPVYVLEEICLEKGESLREETSTKSHCASTGQRSNGVEMIRRDTHKHKHKVPKIKSDHLSNHTKFKSVNNKVSRREKTGNSSQSNNSKLKEDGKNVHICKVCGFMCLRMNDLFRHEKDHEQKCAKQQTIPQIQQSLLNCEFCNYKNFASASLKEHMRQFHSIKLGTKKNNHEAVAKGQQQLHNKNVKKVFKCEFCRYQTRKKDDLRNHTGKYHKKRNKPHRYKCRICGYKSSRKSTIRSHLDQKHPNRELLQDRNENGKDKTNNKKKSLEHAKTMHKPSKIENSLRLHNGKKLHSCNYCNCKFIQKSAMVLHVKSHMEGRFDECKLCSHKSKMKVASA